MSIFGRKKEDGSPDAGSAGGVAVAATRDAEVAMPTFRPAGSAPLSAAGAAPMGPPPRPPGAAPVGAAALPGGAAGRTLAPKPLPEERRTLVVGRGISLQGTVSDAERLVVEGTVESQMIQAAELSVTQTGVFRGEVQVEDAEIAGLFDGTITAKRNLVIRATGKVNGVAKYKHLSVESGGQIMGRMEMLPEPGSVPPEQGG